MAEDYNNNTLQLWGGIECTINRVQDKFFDQLAYAGHYDRPQDISLLIDTGIKKIRYPILWEKHQPFKNKAIDWAATETRLEQLKAARIDVIAGLVHHGSGPAYTNLFDPDFPKLLAAYAAKVAKKFPWINHYTPVNEPLTTARFSGLYGLWYPHKEDDYSFLKMLLHQLKATVLSMQAIRKINPAAKLVQTEDLGKTYSTKPLQYQADFENRRRWLTYDLLCGKVTPKHPLWKYFIKKRITKEELQFFIDNVCTPDIFGFNHYLTSERYLDGRINRYPKHTHGGNAHHRYADVEAARVELKQPTGIKVLLKEAWERYKKPIAVTEAHLHCHREDQLRWFKQIWTSCNDLRKEGVQLEAVTAWAMLGSFGWNKLLTLPKGDYEPGVFDLRSGKPRPTALASFIKGLPDKSALHHLSNDIGWWQRTNRFLHPPKAFRNLISYVPEHKQPILIIGKNGTLGRAFAKVCKDRFLNYKLLSRQECNICNLISVDEAMLRYKPWAVINAAGFVRVDDAEAETENCYNDNTKGAHNLAIAAEKYGIQLLSFSTDLVFDGKKSTPYVEADAVAPLNIYGHSKAKAENLIIAANPSALVIRTSAFFSPWDEYNFLHYVRRSLSQYENISVASDVLISPTYVPDLVHASLDLLIDEESGIWHLTNKGELSWADLANEVADRFKLNRKYIQPLPKKLLNYPAARPAYSVLGSSRGMLLPSLDNALNRYTQEARSITKENISEFRA